MSHRTFRDAIADEFRAHPGEWLSCYALMQVGGALAWRTRVSECRRDLAMTIENKIERDRNGVAVSYYKFTPKPAPEQAGLFQQRTA